MNTSFSEVIKDINILNESLCRINVQSMSGSDPLNSSITMHATPSSVMEGQTFTVTISSSGLPTGTELHWTLSGKRASASMTSIPEI